MPAVHADGLEYRSEWQGEEYQEGENEKEVNEMPVCQECRKFFAVEDDQKRGDCVQRVIDPRQAYYKSKPVPADKDASACREFEKKQSVQ